MLNGEQHIAKGQSNTIAIPFWSCVSYLLLSNNPFKNLLVKIIIIYYSSSLCESVGWFFCLDQLYSSLFSPDGSLTWAAESQMALLICQEVDRDGWITEVSFSVVSQGGLSRSNWGHSPWGISSSSRLVLASLHGSLRGSAAKEGQLLKPKHSSSLCCITFTLVSDWPKPRLKQWRNKVNL